MTDTDESFVRLAKERFGSNYDDLDHQSQIIVDRIFDDYVAKQNGVKVIRQGYTASCKWDEEVNRWICRVIGIKDIIHFEGQDEEDVGKEMDNAIASYENFLEKLNVLGYCKG